MYDTLVTKEEMNSAKDLGKYFRISADQRDLNYDKYFSKGNNSSLEEYNSNNTNILDVDDMKNLLLTLPEIKKDIKNWKY